MLLEHSKIYSPFLPIFGESIEEPIIHYLGINENLQQVQLQQQVQWDTINETDYLRISDTFMNCVHCRKCICQVLVFGAFQVRVCVCKAMQ